MKHFVIVQLLLAVCFARANGIEEHSFLLSDDTDYMKQTLDDMMAHYEGSGASYDQKYYDKLNACFD